MISRSGSSTPVGLIIEQRKSTSPSASPVATISRQAPMLQPKIESDAAVPNALPPTVENSAMTNLQASSTITNQQHLISKAGFVYICSLLYSIILVVHRRVLCLHHRQ
jgi:hypothetical protein